VTPANATISAGSTEQYTATGTYSDGSQQNITQSVTWGSTNTAVATIASGGLATAVAAGSTTIQASSSGITGSTGLTVTGGGGTGGSAGATATQYVLAYTAGNTNQCQVEVSTSATYSPVVLAVDATKFTNANMDGQTNVGNRAFVVGQKWIAQENVSPPSVTVGAAACTYSAPSVAGNPQPQVACTATNSFNVGDSVTVSGMGNTTFNDSWSKIITASSGSFTYVLPHNTTASGTSGGGTVTRANRYSLALAGNVTYDYRIGGPSNTCGANPATGSFTTMIPTNGNTWAETPVIDYTQSPPFQLEPTIFEDRTTVYNDPLSGVQVKRITLFQDHSISGLSTAPQFRTCSTLLSNSGYHCMFITGNSNSGDTASLYWINPTTNEVRFLGYMQSSFVDSSGHTDTVFINSDQVIFDSSDPNRFWVIASTNGGSTPFKLVLGYIEYTGGDVAANPGALWTTAAATIANGCSVDRGGGNICPITVDPSSSLTDQMNSCVTANNPAGTCMQDSNFVAARFSGCEQMAVTGDHIRFECVSALQDSPAWLWDWRIAAGHLGAGGNTYKGIVRWGGTHAHPPTDSNNWDRVSTKALYQTSATGQWEVNLTSAVTAGSTSFTVTGTLDGTTGEPQNTYPFTDANGTKWNFLQPALGAKSGGNGGLGGGTYNGDLFQFQDSTGEFVRLVTKGSCTSTTCTWSTVARGLYGTTAQAHSAGASLLAYCELQANGGLSGVWWNDVNDPTMSDITQTNVVIDPVPSGHGWQSSPNRGVDDAQWVADPPVWTGDWSVGNSSTAGTLLGPANFTVDTFLNFAGVNTDSPGNFAQNYDAWDFYNARFKNSIVNIRYLLGGDTYGTFTNAPFASPHIWKMGASGESGIVFSNLLPYVSMQGLTVLDNVSGPGSLLPNTGSGEICYVQTAGECWPSSSAGEIYGDLPSMDAGVTNCKTNGENAPYTGKDWCFVNIPMYGTSVNQYGLVPGNTITTVNGVPLVDAANSRRLVQTMLGGLRLQGSNVHGLIFDATDFSSCAADPHSNFEGLTNDAYGCHVFMALIPPQPPNDSINRTNFENVSVSTGSPTGADYAIVTFGYRENERQSVTSALTWPPTIHFYCTQYQGQCYYLSGNFSNTVLANATHVGLNATTNLAIGVPQRVLFYQTQYYNASNVLVATDPMGVLAIP
jgi:hypothetical protein